jgi:hypothetical protein
VNAEKHLPYRAGADSGLTEIDAVETLGSGPLFDEEDLACHKTGNLADVLAISGNEDMTACTR